MSDRIPRVGGGRPETAETEYTDEEYSPRGWG